MASTPEAKTVTIDALPTLPQYEKISVDVKILHLYNTQEVGADKVKREVCTTLLPPGLFFGSSM